MTLRPGRRLRARRATRRVKSGLSIVTRASGAAAATASPVSRMRRRRLGSRGKDLGDAHHRQFLHREAADEPLGRHCGAADALDDEGVAEKRAEAGDQGGAEGVAGELSRDEEEADGHASRAQRKRPAASAAATVSP